MNKPVRKCDVKLRSTSCPARRTSSKSRVPWNKSPNSPATGSSITSAGNQRIAGALLERKRYSVATHYRNVDESDVIEVGRAVIEVAARHRELRKIDNEKV